MKVNGADLFLVLCGVLHTLEMTIAELDINDQEVFEPHTSSKQMLNVASGNESSTTITTNGGADVSNNEDVPPYVRNKLIDLPTILWWTHRLFTHKENSILECPKASCRVTSNRKRLSCTKTRGIIFYGSDLNSEDLPVPRMKHHEWALVHEESPMNNHVLTHINMIRLFNHTSTFKRESDYPLTLYSLPSLRYLIERKPLSIDMKNTHRKDGRLAPVVYIQSHKGVASYRDAYVEELMKYIPVDSYGACLHNKDLPEELIDPVEHMGSPRFLDLISKYKFHLAFENALCDDYMTEKLFRVFHVGGVPVHLGSTKVRDWMPDEHSVITVDDFESPKELAKYLLRLDSNDEEYEKYLEYRKPGGITNSLLINHMNNRPYDDSDPEKTNFVQGFECHVCEKINERYETEKKHLSDPNVPLMPPRIAHHSHLNCHQPHPHPSLDQEKLLQALEEKRKASKPGELGQIDWIEDYWQAYSKAVAINKMLQVGETDPGKFNEYWMEAIRDRHDRPGSEL